MTTQIKPPQGAITAVLVVFCGPLRGLPYIYLPSVSVFAVASRLLLDRFQSLCSASGLSSRTRRAVAEQMLTTEALRTVPPTVTQTVSEVLG